MKNKGTLRFEDKILFQKQIEIEVTIPIALKRVIELSVEVVEYKC
tara:strand:+ start:508 stop:642 length:135 start_codon:yes stop_codon:yes gene_type:complete